MSVSPSPLSSPSLLSEERLVAVEAALAEERARTAKLQAELEAALAERDRLRASHERLRLELELLRRRIFVAKAERVDTTQLELEFKDKLAELDKLAATAELSDARPGDDGHPDDGGGGGAGGKGRKTKPTGRRDLRKAPLEEERIELNDPLFEALVTEGKAERIGYEESSKLAWKRGGLRRLVVARVKYRATGASGQVEVETTPMPAESFPRSLAAPSLLAKIITDKLCDGLPLHRIEDRFVRDGFPVDRGTMCRWVEDAGATAGATVVAAARKEAMSTAFCLASDATGVLVQPGRSEPGAKKDRKACRRGHFFVLIADKDHIFFEYTPKENSRVVAEMFRGYSGYVQVDAKSIYNVLFHGPEEKPPDDEACGAVRYEVGCWSHCRRKFWEATVAKSVVAREGLARIVRIFQLDEAFRRHPPAEIARLRNAHLRPHLEAFMLWAEQQVGLVKDQRGMLRSALGYAVRQKEALLRVLDDGRLRLDNNASERELRRIAVGRKAWLFVGSDDHGQSAGHLLSLIASARLHRIDPEAYLRDLFRVLAHWPRDRYLELAPKYWLATRARLDPDELARDIGSLTVPPPRPSEQQTASR